MILTSIKRLYDILKSLLASPLLPFFPIPILRFHPILYPYFLSIPFLSSSLLIFLHLSLAFPSIPYPAKPQSWTIDVFVTVFILSVLSLLVNLSRSVTLAVSLTPSYHSLPSPPLSFLIFSVFFHPVSFQSSSLFCFSIFTSTLFSWSVVHCESLSSCCVNVHYISPPLISPPCPSPFPSFLIARI